jgi:hypothetical protein
MMAIAARAHMRVWVYPDREYADFGAERLSVEWEEMTPRALKRLAADPDYQWDMDTDICTRSEVFQSLVLARQRAKRVLRSGKTAFGQVRIQRQAVDWFVEEDRVAEWADVGEPEYID